MCFHACPLQEVGPGEHANSPRPVKSQTSFSDGSAALSNPYVNIHREWKCNDCIRALLRPEESSADRRDFANCYWVNYSACVFNKLFQSSAGLWGRHQCVHDGENMKRRGLYWAQVLLRGPSSKLVDGSVTWRSFWSWFIKPKFIFNTFWMRFQRLSIHTGSFTIMFSNSGLFPPQSLCDNKSWKTIIIQKQSSSSGILLISEILYQFKVSVV